MEKSCALPKYLYLFKCLFKDPEQRQIQQSADHRSQHKPARSLKKRPHHTDTVPDRTEVGACIVIYIDGLYLLCHDGNSLLCTDKQNLCLILEPLSRNLKHQIQKTPVKRPESCLCVA